MAGIVLITLCWAIIYSIFFFAAIGWHELGHYVMYYYFTGEPPHFRWVNTPVPKPNEKGYVWWRHVWKHIMPFLPYGEFEMFPRNPCKITNKQQIAVLWVGILSGVLWLIVCAKVLSYVNIWSHSYIHVPMAVCLIGMYCYGSLYDVREIERLLN